MSSFKDLKIKKKLFLGFFVVIVLLLVLVLILFFNFQKIKQLNSDASQRSSQSLIASEAASMPYLLYSVFADAAINRDFELNKNNFETFKKRVNR